MLIISFRYFSLLLLVSLIAACSINKYNIIKPRDNGYLKSQAIPALEVPSDLLSPGDRDIFFIPEGKQGAVPASIIPPGSILQRTRKS